MGRSCPHCNSSEIDEDPARGDATCMNCGTVLEESRIVSDVQFQETGAGGHEIIGQFVSSDRAHAAGTGAKPESREVTYYKGKKLIQEIASQLRINSHCVNTAYNFFKMCVSRNFTRGRIRAHVVAACLYMTCRLENTSHLLLDFSDVTQVNVFDLGRTLNFLTRSLKINLPTTDPCLYVLRFAILLEFGDKQKEVVTFATRIVQRMKRDWMATGRRPTGICGAALLLAARAFNINRSVTDIVRVVHISETVVRKRIDEFTNTPSGGLTIDEFNIVDLEESEDPPAYQASKRRYRESKRAEEELQADQAVKEVGGLQKEVEEALKQKMKKSPYAKLVSGIGNEDDLSEAADVLRSEIIDSVYKMAENDETIVSNGGDSSLSMSHQAQMYGPTLQSLGILQHPSTSTAPELQPAMSAAEQLGELDLDGIDDDEIDSYILSREEADVKTDLWTQRNGDIMDQLEKKRQLKLELEEKERENPKAKRKLNKKVPINAANHNEAMLQVIQEKRLSNKINYEILKELEHGSQPPAGAPAAPAEVPNGKPTEPPTPAPPPPPISVERVRTASISSVASITNAGGAQAAVVVSTVEVVAPARPAPQTAPAAAPAVPSVSNGDVEVHTATQPAVLSSTQPPSLSPTKSATPAPPKPPTQSRYKRNMVAPKLGPAAKTKRRESVSQK
ncbi:B-related factor 1 [Aphelenchoides fujianensis]|nr:B-related factor 1 [Aphelenchoides fujianensis]